MLFKKKNMESKVTLATAAFYFRESSLPQGHRGQWMLTAAQHSAWLIPLV